MTQEDKQLLLKDLCARLPYELWVMYQGNYYLVTGCGHGRVSLLTSPVSSACGPCPLVEEVKPYLRPLSSMTEEEKYIYRHMLGATLNSEGESIMFVYVEDFSTVIDWLNAHHFDYRGLIDKGLAIEVTEENNPYR